MIRYDPDKNVLRLSVGDIVHYGEAPAVRQTPALGLRLAAGSREHRAWQHTSETQVDEGDFAAEVALEYRHTLENTVAVVEGRIDGLRKDETNLVVEEVKTVVLPDEAWSEDELRAAVISGAAYGHYQFQLEIYLLMVHATQTEDLFPTRDGMPPGSDTPATSPHGRLIFRNLACDDEDRREISIDIEADIDSIQKRVHERLELILEEIDDREERRLRASELASRLPFPFPSYRPHQEEISLTALETLEAGNHLLLSAPPGLGKTAAILHAALRFALPRGFKVFWLTAKTTQQRLVAETVRLMLDRLEFAENATGPTPPPPLRAVVLRAREKACPNVKDGGRVFCHDAYCRYARDHWRKVRQHRVLDDLLELPVIEPDEVYSRTVRAEACPYEVSVAAATEANLIIGDYNYIFDPNSRLQRLEIDRIASQSILVIDEAHNLLSRGREAHSPVLERQVFETLLECSRSEALTEVIHRATGHFLEQLAEVAETTELRPGDHAGRVEIDDDFLDEFAADVERWRTRRLMEKRAAPVILPDALDDALDACSKSLKRFLSTLDLEEQRASFASLLERGRKTDQLRLLCLDPSSLLKEQLERFHAAIAISATLSPLEFFRDMLGFPHETTRTLAFPSPFPKQNRGIFIDPSFATTYRKRSAHAARIARTVDAIAREHRGNYLVFLSSHSYLREVVAHVEANRIGDDVLVQKRFMSEEARDRTLALLREPDSNRILYAVQGGIFGEGVDYAGGMAAGVIVVGPGLPRFDHEQELIREHFDRQYDRGFEYAYLYPGMHRVIQAAGRVIRSPDDVGIVVLLGERFGDSQYSGLFPEDWYETSPRELITNDLAKDIRAFWKTRS